MHKSLAMTASLIALIVLIGQWATYTQIIIIQFALPLMLILVGVVTFFGILMLPDGTDSNTSLSEARVRLCITATLLMVYIVYLGSVVFWRSERMTDFEKQMVSTLTTLLAVVLPFYFGSSAAVDIVKRRAESHTKESAKQSDSIDREL